MKSACSIILLLILFLNNFTSEACLFSGTRRFQRERNTCCLHYKSGPCRKSCSHVCPQRGNCNRKKHNNPACLLCPAKTKADLPESSFDKSFLYPRILYGEFGDPLLNLSGKPGIRRECLFLETPAPVKLQFFPMLC